MRDNKAEYELKSGEIYHFAFLSLSESLSSFWVKWPFGSTKKEIHSQPQQQQNMD